MYDFQLHMLLDELLASKVAVRLLRVLSGRPYEDLYFKRLVREADVGVGSADRSMKAFEDAKIVVARSSGKQRLYRLNLDNKVASKLYELFSLEKLTEVAHGYKAVLDDVTSILIKGVGQQLRSIVLFGSVATGLAKTGSDVDLLIITKRPRQEYGDIWNEIKRRASFYQTLIQEHCYYEDEFEKGYQKGDDLITNALRDGVVVYDDGYFRGFISRPLPPASPGVIRSLLEQAIKDVATARRNFSEEDYGTTIELLRLATERAARAELLEKGRLAGSRHGLSGALVGTSSGGTVKLVNLVQRYSDQYAHTGNLPSKEKVWNLLQAIEDLVRGRLDDLSRLVG